MPDDEISDDLLRSIVDSINHGLYFVEPDRTIRSWNRGAEKISGYEAKDIVGHRCFDNILAHVDGRGVSLCHSSCPLAASMKDGEAREMTIWLRHKEGFRKPVRVRTAAVRDKDGNIIGGVESFTDASELEMSAEEAERARREALTDGLTGLPNRRMFDAALAGRLENMARYGWGFGLLIADIDHFKVVNDKYGHPAGDAALVMVARTLLGAVRAGDMVARWGGEEFAVLVEASDASGLHETAERIRTLIAESEVRHEDRRLSLRVSVGGSLARQGDSAESLFTRADQAMYAAKHEGRNRTALVG